MWERVRARSGAGNSPAVIRRQTAGGIIPDLLLTIKELISHKKG